MKDHQDMEQVANMLPPAFKAWLKNCSEEELSLLKKMSVFEPLQHQLTFLSHELEKELDQSHKKTMDLVGDILSQAIETLSFKGLNDRLSMITQLHNEEEELYHLICRALLIAWNGQRTDLIEKLTLLKEGSHRMLHEYIGQPRRETHVPTGIYEVLELHFGAVFGNPKDPEENEALKDDEPGIEALAKLHLWSLQDYKGIGLLPEFDVTSWEAMKNHEEQYRAYETEMHQHLAQRLEALGLNSVGDFKKAQIYNQEMLKDFLYKGKTNT